MSGSCGPTFHERDVLNAIDRDLREHVLLPPQLPLDRLNLGAEFFRQNGQGLQVTAYRLLHALLNGQTVGQVVDVGQVDAPHVRALAIEGELKTRRPASAGRGSFSY